MQADDYVWMDDNIDLNTNEYPYDCYRVAVLRGGRSGVGRTRVAHPWNQRTIQ